MHSRAAGYNHPGPKVGTTQVCHGVLQGAVSSHCHWPTLAGIRASAPPPVVCTQLLPPAQAALQPHAVLLQCTGGRGGCTHPQRSHPGLTGSAAARGTLGHEGTSCTRGRGPAQPRTAGHRDRGQGTGLLRLLVPGLCAAGTQGSGVLPGCV